MSILGKLLNALFISPEIEQERRKELERTRTAAQNARDYAHASLDRLDARLAELEEELRKESRR